ncbi:hypothetical protein [Candidatus Phycosocius spiralis]|uniref:COQ9 domain-containing protein n=1 Tax=Candidatus Phycosocius spiralis TaxID=2815099 RepID=A0ABQ4PXU4_9PROT|nr:hypothetical protein [Candidatus Phycosocius spiralis]GIU67503.1 hypothetical protein PsB1_1657 [Candidatus Phycosocius spiralis]
MSQFQPKTSPILEALSDAALAVCATTPWSEVSLIALCKEAKINLADCADAAVQKATIAAYLDQGLDRHMLKNASELMLDHKVADGLFDCFMARFDGMEIQRSAWVSILKADALDPAASFARATRRARTSAWALEALGVDTTMMWAWFGVLDLARRLKKMETLWLDDGPDLSKTMAGLDQSLKESERWASHVAGLGAYFKRQHLNR